MADERIKKRRLELLVKIFRARLNYLSAGILTLVNIALMLFGTDLELPFYLCIPYFAFLTGRSCVGNPERFGAMILWFALALLFVGIYIWLFRRSKAENRIGGLLALILADTAANVGLILFMLVVSAQGASIFTMALNLAFHVFVIVFVEGGRRAAYGLTVLPDEEGSEPDEDVPDEMDGDGEE